MSNTRRRSSLFISLLKFRSLCVDIVISRGLILQIHKQGRKAFLLSNFLAWFELPTRHFPTRLHSYWLEHQPFLLICPLRHYWLPRAAHSSACALHTQMYALCETLLGTYGGPHTLILHAISNIYHLELCRWDQSFASTHFEEQSMVVMIHCCCHCDCGRGPTRTMPHCAKGHAPGINTNFVHGCPIRNEYCLFQNSLPVIPLP